MELDPLKPTPEEPQIFFQRIETGSKDLAQKEESHNTLCNLRLYWESSIIQDKNETIALSVKSPCLHPVFGPGFIPYPLVMWDLQSMAI
jgi:hypothetical protein